MALRIEVRTALPVRKLRMLGLDFGLSYTGYAVAEVDVAKTAITGVPHLGVITTKSRRQDPTTRKTTDDVRRASIIAESVLEIVREYEVDIVAAEIVTATQYLRPTFGFGVLVGIAASLDRPLIRVLPWQAKVSATGLRHASKKQVIDWATSIAPEASWWPRSGRMNALGICVGGRPVGLVAEHQADALAVIQAAVNSDQFGLAAISVDPGMMEDGL